MGHQPASPAAHPASNPTPSSVSPDSAPERVQGEVADNTPPTPAEVPLATNPVIMLLITMIAIFPFAFGLGTVRAKAAATARLQAQRNLQRQIAVPPPAPVLRQVDLYQGDLQFFQQKYDAALVLYETLKSTQPESQQMDLLYRIGLCQEGLGAWDSALAAYARVATSAESSVLKAGALCSQARIHLRLDDFKTAAQLLRTLEFHLGPEAALPRSLSQEVGFLLPLTLAQEVLRDGQSAERQKIERLNDLLIWSLQAALQWTIDNGQTVAAPIDARPAANEFVVQTRSRSASFATIDDATADIRCADERLKVIVERLASACGWTVDWTDLSGEQSLNESMACRIDDHSVCLLLTAICSPLEAVWSFSDNKITIKRLHAKDASQNAMHVRTLQSVMNGSPLHRHADHCQFCLASFALNDGEDERAAELYASLVGKTSSNLACRAAYIAGTIYFARNDFRRAGSQLAHAVNGDTRSDWHAAATILLGRVLMDRGETQEAIFQFRRAIEVESQPSDQALAATLMGMALAMQEKYQFAGQVILEQRFKMKDQTVRLVAALVTSLVRWKTLPERMRESEVAYLYRAVVAVTADREAYEQNFGQTGQLLIGHAYLALEMQEEMVEQFSRMLSPVTTDSIKTEITYRLAKNDYSNGQLTQARSMLESIVNSPFERWSSWARLTLAEIDLAQNQADQCLQRCESIGPGFGITRAEIRRLQGRAYEQLGDPVSAARCYAGRR